MFRKISFIMFLSLSITLAQQDVVKESLKFYPLHIGDYWQYKVIKAPFGIEDTSWFGYKEVIGDSIMPNNKKYFVVSEYKLPSINFSNTYNILHYIRIDSLTGNVYEYQMNYEKKIDNLLVQKGDTVIYGFKCTEDTIKEFFGMKVNSKKIEPYLISSTSYYGWERAELFGEVMRYYEDIFVYYILYKSDIIYAKIDGKEYGLKVNSVEENSIPDKFILYQNYPNPFNSITRISFLLPEASFVTLNIFDMLGQKISTLINKEIMFSGLHEIKFDAKDLPAGIYFYVLNTNRYRSVRKMILLK